MLTDTSRNWMDLRRLRSERLLGNFPSDDPRQQIFGCIQRGKLRLKGNLEIVVKEIYQPHRKWYFKRQNKNIPSSLLTKIDFDNVTMIGNFISFYIIRTNRDWRTVGYSVTIENSRLNVSDIDKLWPRKPFGKISNGKRGRDSFDWSWFRERIKRHDSQRSSPLSDQSLAVKLLDKFKATFPGQDAPALGTARKAVGKIRKELAKPASSG